MLTVLFNIKEGKRLLIQGPTKCSDKFWNKVDHSVKQYNSIFILVVGIEKS